MSAPDARPKLLTVETIAELTHTPVSSVRWWLDCGKLRYYKPGRRRLVAESDLWAFVESTASTAPNTQDVADSPSSLAEARTPRRLRPVGK